MKLNTNRLLIALIVGFALSPLVQAQLKTFKPGDVIKSSEINENFEYLEEQIGSAGDAASAQCSATQDGSNVVISCTDGSSAVLAGAGKVVAYPEGTLGQIPPLDYDSGPIVVVDANGVVLGETDASNDNVWFNIKLYRGEARIANQTEGTIAFSAQLPHLIGFLEPDCAGEPFGISLGTGEMVSFNQQYFFPIAEIQPETLL